MRISEMRCREALDTILSTTLSKTWSEMHGETICVQSGSAETGMNWMVQPLLNAYFLPPVASAARQFLKDGFCSTPVLWRKPAQRLLGNLLCTPAGLRLSSTSGFNVSHRLPDEAHMLVVPGNHRIRLFNFKKGSCRVVLKSGFNPAAMEREIQVRGSSQDGPFPAIIAWHKDPWWFEEEILSAYALPRCPDEKTRGDATAMALKAMDQWSAPTRQSEQASDCGSILLSELSNCFDLIRRKFPGRGLRFGNSGKSFLLNACAGLGLIETTIGHGDFQPGNIMVSKDGSGVLIIDWEHSSRRFAWYDRMVLGLASRYPRGLAARIYNFINGWTPDTLMGLRRDRSYRMGLSALFILEDFSFYAKECLVGLFSAPSVGFLQYCQELSCLLPRISSCQGVS